VSILTANGHPLLKVHAVSDLMRRRQGYLESDPDPYRVIRQTDNLSERLRMSVDVEQQDALRRHDEQLQATQTEEERAIYDLVMQRVREKADATPRPAHRSDLDHQRHALRMVTDEEMQKVETFFAGADQLNDEEARLMFEITQATTDPDRKATLKQFFTDLRPDVPDAFLKCFEPLFIALNAPPGMIYNARKHVYTLPNCRHLWLFIELDIDDYPWLSQRFQGRLNPVPMPEGCDASLAEYSLEISGPPKEIDGVPQPADTVHLCLRDRRTVDTMPTGKQIFSAIVYCFDHVRRRHKTQFRAMWRQIEMSLHTVFTYHVLEPY
jgi:hypothetical protein